MNGRVVFASVVVLAAIAVNAGHVWRWLSPAARAESAPYDEPDTPGAAPAGPELAPARVGAAFAPETNTDDLADPFGRDTVSPAPGTAATAQRALLPHVRVILRTHRGRRAVLDADSVGVGDQVATGTVIAIEHDHVLLRNAQGVTVRLPLPERGTPRGSGDTGATPAKEDK